MNLVYYFQTECKNKDSCCRTTNQCGMGQGDCDSNADCNPGLVCGTNNCIGFSFNHQDNYCRFPSKGEDHLG